MYHGPHCFTAIHIYALHHLTLDYTLTKACIHTHTRTHMSTYAEIKSSSLWIGANRFVSDWSGCGEFQNGSNGSNGWLLANHSRCYILIWLWNMLAVECYSKLDPNSTIWLHLAPLKVQSTPWVIRQNGYFRESVPVPYSTWKKLCMKPLQWWKNQRNGNAEKIKL